MPKDYCTIAGVQPIPFVTRPLGWILWDPCIILRGITESSSICDYGTWYPEAIALLLAPRIARELANLCSRMGIPDEILTIIMSSCWKRSTRCSISPGSGVHPTIRRLMDLRNGSMGLSSQC